MATAKSLDYILNLLSDIMTPPIQVYCIINAVNWQYFSEVWLCQVKQRQCRREVLCFAQSEVQCATHARRHFTAQQLHDASALLIVPQGNAR